MIPSLPLSSSCYTINVGVILVVILPLFRLWLAAMWNGQPGVVFTTLVGWRRHWEVTPVGSISGPNMIWARFKEAGHSVDTALKVGNR